MVRVDIGFAGEYEHPMDRKRCWTYSLNGLTVFWIVLFVVSLAVDVGLLSLPSASASVIDRFLRLAVIVFLADVCLLYRWSEEAPTAFVRSHWFLILTVVPWFRPLRALRIGRGLRVFRTLSRSRRVGSLLHKLRRALKRVRNR